jgi:RNA polymerase sigma factor (sigma-70 family)
MEFSDAVNWVKSNQGLIKKTIGKYTMFSPYEENDYMQDAFESAMVATLRSKSKGISFESAFWQVFRKNLSDVTPNLKSSRYGSNSVPSFLCSEDTETTEISERKEIPGPDIEAVFQLIRNHLTEREKTVFTLALGLTESGALSSYEIAERLNCSAPNIRIASIRVYERIKRLVDEGVINPNSFIDIGQPVCISSAGGA